MVFSDSNPPWRIALVVQQARERGLKCQWLRYQTAGWFDSRRLFIEGRKCQVVSASVFNATPRIEALSLYFPTTTWADFFIYVSNQPPHTIFVVPRGAIDKDTGTCSPESWIFKYQDAWSLLTEDLSPDKLERRFQILNWKTTVVVDAAEKRGYRVELIPKRTKHFPFHVQNRILINGRRCQVMSASRVSANSSSAEWKVINLNPPRDNWAEFLFFVVRLGDDRNSVFVIPRDRIPRKTTTTLSSGWFLDFLGAWGPIKTSPGDDAPGQHTPV